MKLEEAIKTVNFKDSVHRATLNVMYSAYWLKSHISNTLKDKGITAEQFNVLRILKGKYPEAMCVKDIGSRMIEKSSNVPRILDRLVAKKLVSRTASKTDKRETLIGINSQGIVLLEDVNTLLEHNMDQITGIDEKEAEQLNSLLEKMRKVD